MPAINEVFWANEANVVVAKIKYNNGSPFFFFTQPMIYYLSCGQPLQLKMKL